MFSSTPSSLLFLLIFIFISIFVLVLLFAFIDRDRCRRYRTCTLDVADFDLRLIFQFPTTVAYEVVSFPVNNRQLDVSLCLPFQPFAHHSQS